MSDEDIEPQSQDAADSDSGRHKELEIKLSTHAEKKIAERHLDQNQVTTVASDPEQIVYEENYAPRCTIACFEMKTKFGSSSQIILPPK